MELIHTTSRSSAGFVMFDVVLWLGLGIGIATAALMLFVTTWSTGEVAQAQQWVQETAQRAMSSYASRPDFSLLNQDTAQQDNLFPAAAITGGQLTDPWGGDFAISVIDTPLRPKGAAVITMDQVPASDCVKLAAALATSADSISVSGTIVSSGHTTPDPRVTGLTCGAKGRLQFTYIKR